MSEYGTDDSAATDAPPPAFSEAVEGPSDDKADGSHTWGSATTSLIAPTADTAAAVDPHAGERAAHDDARSQVQAAIDAVAETHVGQGREVIADALRAALEARGRWPQPAPWVDAVASDLEDGKVYQTGA